MKQEQNKSIFLIFLRAPFVALQTFKQHSTFRGKPCLEQLKLLMPLQFELFVSKFLIFQILSLQTFCLIHSQKSMSGCRGQGVHLTPTLRKFRIKEITDNISIVRRSPHLAEKSSFNSRLKKHRPISSNLSFVSNKFTLNAFQHSSNAISRKSAGNFAFQNITLMFNEGVREIVALYMSQIMESGLISKLGLEN